MRYFFCSQDKFCGERLQYLSTKIGQIRIMDPAFSPGSSCSYEFRFPPMGAGKNDVMKIEVENIQNADLLYAEGVD